MRIREFLLAPLDRRVAELMDRRFVALKATDDQEAAVGVFRQYDRTALPVTDTAGMLIGIVTIDDVLDVAEATATRDIQRIGGSEALDEPYISIAFGRMIQKRAGWLTALFLGEMLTATAMGVFEAEISKAVVLALFVPLIISSGGNSGSQAATLVIRALALGEVGVRDWWRVMRREVLAGLALGAILGSIGFLRISLWSAFSDIYGPHWLLVAITVSVSLVGVVLWGTLSGSLLPFLLKRLGFDPAASSAPFVATLVDVTGLVIYFSVALVGTAGNALVALAVVRRSTFDVRRSMFGVRRSNEERQARERRTKSVYRGSSREGAMDEHDDDLASEVIEGEEIESDTFEAEDDEDVLSAEDGEEKEDEAPPEDDSEI